MKKMITPLFAMALFLASCGGTTEDKKTDADKKETKTEVSEEEQNNVAEVAEVEETNTPLSEKNKERMNNLSLENNISDCYLVDHFKYEDKTYITVDFVNYKINETDSGPEVELVNVIKTLRTFVVNTEYLDCAKDKKVSIDELLKKFDEDKFTLYGIETDQGIVNELYITGCED